MLSNASYDIPAASLVNGLHEPAFNLRATTSEHRTPADRTVVEGRYDDQELFQISEFLSGPPMAHGGCRMAAPSVDRTPCS